MKKYILVLISIWAFVGCGSDYLNLKPDKSLVVPKSLEDVQALLDNEVRLNRNTVPYHGEVASDDFFLNDRDWQTLTLDVHRNSYRWDDDMYGSMQTDNVWNMSYQAIFYANVALEIAQKHDASVQRDELVGAALFFRSWMHYWLLNLYARQFNTSTSEIDLAPPIRLESDINGKSTRTTVKKAYDILELELIEAARLLPDIAVVSTRPSKQSCYVLLARLMLQKLEYNKALLYAEKALAIRNQLMDYNKIGLGHTYPFPRMNEEVVFYTYFYAQPFNIARFQVVPELYNSYEAFDLRKNLFFFQNNGHLTFRGSYDGSDYLFCGLSIDELYLIKSECLVRQRKVDQAFETINQLLKTRTKTDMFIPLDPINEEEALSIILEERRKQMLFRGTRWLDLKRLNLDPSFAKTITRKIGGVVYTLEPNSEKYIFPMPPDVLKLNNW